MLDSDKNRSGGAKRLTPLRIAVHPLFTAHVGVRDAVGSDTMLRGGA